MNKSVDLQLEAPSSLVPIDQRKIFFKQIWILTVSNLKARYRRTFAGFLWVVMNPILMLFVQAQVFGYFLKLQIPEFSLYLLSGLLPWIFIVQTLEMGTGTLVYSGRIFKAFPVHPLVFLAAQMLDNLINFLAAFFIVFIPFSRTHPGVWHGVLLFPFAFLPMVVGILGMTWFLSTLFVFFRDVRFVLTFVLNIAFYLTPIFYTTNFIPAHLKWLTQVNPFYYFIDCFHQSLYEYNVRGFWLADLKAWGVALALALLGYFFWRRKKNAVFFYI